MLIMGILCTFYTTIGGIKAVIWTDVLQVRFCQELAFNLPRKYRVFLKKVLHKREENRQDKMKMI